MMIADDCQHAAVSRRPRLNFGDGPFTQRDEVGLSASATEFEGRETRLCRWLGQAIPGDTLVYHRGSLAIDVDPLTSKLAGADRHELTRVARWARQAFAAGLVHLAQYRHGADDYSYLLIARPHPKTARTTFSILVLGLSR